ncbi:MAG: glutathione S-transferase family protein [Pseudomonadota bacterium]
MTITLTAFRWVPPFAQGFVKDLRVRWALEEAGLAYEVTLIDPLIQASEAYRAWQPFGQVPAYRDDEVELFESGAIVLHVAAKSEALAPIDAADRARVSSWVIAALNSIEPYVVNLVQPSDARSAVKARTMLRERLAALAAWLGERDYLEDRFTAGDLMMTTVLRELVTSGVLDAFPTLDALRQRCEARPAFGRALEAQMRPFRENAPA